MKVEQIKTADDVERYIEGCLNDFEEGISEKDETLVYLAELVAHVYTKATEEKQVITTKQQDNENIYNSSNQWPVKSGSQRGNQLLTDGRDYE